MPTISASVFTNIAESMSAKNSNIKEITSYYKVHLSESTEPHRLELDLAYRFFNEAYECTGDADIGLVAYQYAKPYFFGLPGYSVMSSPTLEVALARVAKYYPLIVDASFIHLEDSGGHLTITVLANDETRTQAPRYIVDATAALILGLIHWLAHPLKIQPQRIDMPYPRPAETKSLERLFGPRINFDAPHLSLSFNNEIKQAQVFTSSPALEAIHCRYADALLEEQLEGALVEKVRSAFSAGVAGGKLLTLQDVALALRMSKRTLQKSLEREGVTFSELQETLRKELAGQLLSSSALSLKKISSILGFCQSSSLHKACKRWFGQSPGQLRTKKNKSLEAN